MAKILLIDDDHELGEFLRKEWTNHGHEVRWFDAAEDALKILGAPHQYDVVFLDNKMPRMTGIEFLAALKAKNIRIPVILMTSVYGNQTVFDAINNGAMDYAIKPVEFDDFTATLQPFIDEALTINRPPRPVILPTSPDPSEDNSTIVGRSKPILNMLKKIARVAQMDETVLILGETGTGKDLVARAIHTNSQRSDKPFVIMDCTAFNENLLDDELFGHEIGAFSGAVKLRKGRFEHAHGGTLFLDEVGDMPMTLQAKLLRVLENREVVRIGSNEPIKVNVRIVAATHKDLKALVRDGEFRQDLFFRLEGVTIVLPPLRERQGDIELLADRFLRRLFDNSAPRLIHPDAVQKLKDHHWPGNVRQLQKVLCRAVYNCRGTEICSKDLDFGELAGDDDAGQSPPDTDIGSHLRRVVELAWEQGNGNLLPRLQEQLEKECIRFAVGVPNLSQVQQAKRLGIARNTLRARIEQFNLDNE